MTDFDRLQDYDAEIPEHIRVHLLEKKISLQIQKILTHQIPQNATILDIGCGTGWHLKSMKEHGYNTIGIDTSLGQCKRAQTNSTSHQILNSSVLSLPFKENSFDVVYTINTLHHLQNEEEQRLAFKKIYNIIKPGGLLIIHEINVFNPLMRIYMDHIFPRFRNIDNGTEHWLNPDKIAEFSKEFSNYESEYYTFVPDFCPQTLLPTMLTLEKTLENSWFKKHSAHFMCVCYKESDE